MFKQNKYTRIYFQIINRAKNRIIDGYTEKHHIIPKCLDGKDEKENIVILTAREHFICHWLLTKMTLHRNSKLLYGFIMMINCNNEFQQRFFRVTSKLYEIHKRINSQLASEKFSGKQKHNVGKSRYYDPNTGKISLLSQHESISTSLIKGSPDWLKNKLSEDGVGRGVYAYDSNNKVRRFNTDNDIPEGWIKGNPNCITRGSEDTIMISNAQGEQRRISRDDDIPFGWTIGSSMVWITDGVYEKQIRKIDNLPDGWLLGRSKRKNSKKIYHDPITNREKQYIENTQPDGWIIGRSNSTRDKLKKQNIGNMYYDPNSRSQKRVKNPIDIPPGWSLGINPRVSSENKGNTKHEKLYKN